MLKFVTIIGARPQFIKAAAISRVFRTKGKGLAREIHVHTGQHYDDNMSKVFFEQMEIPEPEYNLGVGSASHGAQTGSMIMKIEEVLLKEKPNMVIVYGDTNSTLAGAVAASKLNIPVSHIEAGLRSFNKSMPEEINRILADHVSTLLFSPTVTGFENLMMEGFAKNPTPPFTADNPKVFHCGDVMYDNAKYYGDKAEAFSHLFEKKGLRKGDYILCTIHRDSNTDIPERLNGLFRSLNRISKENNIAIVLPLHPRTRKMIDLNLRREIRAEIEANINFLMTEPLSYLEMLLLEKHSRMIITDSGGVQKESYFFRKPCIVLRKESEWKELLEAGTATLADANEEKIISAFRHYRSFPPDNFPQIYGDGNASLFIFDRMIDLLTQK